MTAELAEIAQLAGLKMGRKLITSIILGRFIIVFLQVVRCKDLDRRLIICHFELVVRLVHVLGFDHILGVSLSCKLQLLLEVLAVVKVLSVVGLDVIVGSMIFTSFLELMLDCSHAAVWPCRPCQSGRIESCSSGVMSRSSRARCSDLIRGARAA